MRSSGVKSLAPNESISAAVHASVRLHESIWSDVSRTKEYLHVRTCMQLMRVKWAECQAFRFYQSESVLARSKIKCNERKTGRKRIKCWWRPNYMYMHFRFLKYIDSIPMPNRTFSHALIRGGGGGVRKLHEFFL